NKHYGSRNFILLEHTYGAKKFFSLYMHLKNISLDPNNATIKKIKWLATNDLQANLDALKTGDVVKFDCELRAGDVLWISGEYGSSSLRCRLLHWEMFSETNIFEAPPPAPSPALDGNTGWATLSPADQVLRVKAVSADKQNAFEGDQIVFAVTKCNYKDAPNTEQNKINWKVTSTDGGYSTVFNAKGLKLEFQVPAEVRGKIIKAQPYVHSPSSAVVA